MVPVTGLARTHLFVWSIGACWIVLAAVWIGLAGGAKRAARRGGWGLWAGSRLFLVALIAFVLIDKPLSRALGHYQRAIDAVPAVGALGMLLCAAGIAVAIWARVCLGRNWGMPMSLKEAPELVTDGPYAHVRHPIYSGILLAALGSTLVILVWIAPLIVLVPYFIYSARREERLMLAEFPERYPAYLRRTWMLIPLVL
jgi:isoprenylcysteine carboxyl methyltransferase (ICMT) family protein YpbQ